MGDMSTAQCNAQTETSLAEKKNAFYGSFNAV